MSGSIPEVLLAVAFPIAASALGAAVAANRPVPPQLRSAIQHFAGGLIFAAVAVELLPDIHGAHPLPVVIGAALGLGLMLAVRAIAGGEEEDGADGGNRLAATVGVDLAIDGLLLGIAFSIGSDEGIVLTVGLTAELLSLGLAVAGTLNSQGASRARATLLPVSLTLLLAVGAVLGVSIFGGLSGAAFAAVVGLGSVALLYLVTEELLREAHRDTADSPWTISAFFAGFVLLLVL